MPRKVVNSAQGASQSHNLQPSEAPKSSKTRMPPLVRGRKPRVKQPVAAESAPHSTAHTSPSLSVHSPESEERPDYIGMLMEHVHSAIRTRNWEKLGDLVDSISDPDKGFALEPLAEHPLVKTLLDEGALRVLTANSPPSYVQISLALDLMTMGGDMNAKDQHGKTVLNILRSAMDDKLRQFITSEHPYFKHLFIDQNGQTIQAD